MRVKCLVCLLLVSLTYGQAPTPMTPAAGAKPEQNAPAAGQTPAPTQAPAGADTAGEAKAPEGGPNDTVITIKGFCPRTPDSPFGGPENVRRCREARPGQAALL